MVHGIAGIGKSIPVSHWLSKHKMENKNLCVLVSTSSLGQGIGLATSLLHRFGVDENHDPYNLIDTSNLSKWMLNYGTGACLPILPMLTQSESVSVEEKADLHHINMIILDDVHLIENECKELLTALLTLSTKPTKASNDLQGNLSFYDRRDVFTRKIPRNARKA